MNRDNGIRSIIRTAEQDDTFDLIHVGFSRRQAGIQIGCHFLTFSGQLQVGLRSLSLVSSRA